jgi:hypothetical protein
MLLMLLATIASSSAVARQSSTITKAEARSLPASQVKRRIMDQLSDILAEERFSQRKPPVNPLTDMSFVTKPRATAVPNLCQIDRLTITFRSEGDGKGNADTPVSANGFSSTRYFHFNKPPSDNYHTIVDYDHSPNDMACRNAKLWENEFFTASDDSVATDGYLLAHRTMDAIIAGNPTFPLACNKHPVETKRECADIVREIRSDPISSIDQCETDIPELASAFCYRVFVDDRSLRIIASRYASGPNVPPPLTVLRVELDSLIVLWHERVD